MIERLIFGQPTLDVVKRSLDVYADRGKVHARNVANAETPGYRAQEVRFEEDLQLALRTGAEGRLAATDDRHLGAAGGLPPGKLAARNPESVWTASGQNDVEIDREMADIARNTMRFTVAAQMVARAYEGMRKAIHGRRTG
jgi:flagellar basal-body rod protein FlgB